MATILNYEVREQQSNGDAEGNEHDINDVLEDYESDEGNFSDEDRLGECTRRL